MAEPPL